MEGGAEKALLISRRGFTIIHPAALIFMCLRQPRRRDTVKWVQIGNGGVVSRGVIHYGYYC